MDSSAKNRLRLWLRAEKALGLDAVAVPRGSVRRREDRPGAQPAAQAPRSQTPRTPPLAAGVVSTPAGSSRVPASSPRQAAPVRQPVAAAPHPTLMPAPASTPFTAPVLPTAQKQAALEAMNRNEVVGCTLCRLCESRTHTVFGEGDVDAQLMFIGEGPGENEDRAGRPFVGRAGQLLDKMIVAMGLRRDAVFITNIVKCRPPGNRAPAPDEVSACTPYLQRQIEIIRPRVIVTLGLPATQTMLETKISMGKMRGHWHAWRGIQLMPTYHPAYVLRNYTDAVRAAVWSDLQQVMTLLGLPRKDVRSREAQA